jgi:prevent-host-death family protein
MERKLDITEARKSLATIVDRVSYQGDNYIIVRHGEAAAAVVPMEVYRRWKKERRELFQTIREVQAVNPDADPDQVAQEVLEAQRAVRQATAGRAAYARRARR